MNTAELTATARYALERTGTLQTRDPYDVGHISDFWRQKITELCNAIEAGAPATIAATQPEGAQVDALITAASKVLFSELPTEKLVRAAWLIEEAAPIMQALNNPRGERWLAVAGTDVALA